MRELYRKLFSLLDERERRRFWLLTGVMIAVALVEVVGISSVLILLNVLADPSTVETNWALSLAYDRFGFEDPFNFQVFLAATVTLVVLCGIAVKAGGTYLAIRYAIMRGAAISSRLLGAYLHQPYTWFLTRNSSEIGKNVLNEVDGLVGRVLSPLLRLIASCLLVCVIVGFLLFVDPVVTLISAGLLGGSYMLIYLKMRERLRRAGEDMMNAFAERFRVALESTGGIKDVKLLGLEDGYTQAYATAAHKSASAAAAVGIVSELPRFALEGITFSALLALVLMLLFRSDGNIAEIVPTLGVYAFSVMRLLPALQQIYFGFASIRGARAALDTVTTDYAEAVRSPRPSAGVKGLIRLDHRLELSRVCFSYETAERQAILDLDMVIPARTTVGIVGGTGAGKTTLVDLVLGLLSPQAGAILVDGTAITADNVRLWQKSMGYVPQSIFLTDDTIAANIAFGIPKAGIDMAAVERAARAAALHDFVTEELPLAYDTVVGERGVRLSGGQRQRIGIARALYRDPTLLIMDEATSALDNLTERVVMEAVQNIRADKTIILIAHRLSTVKNCDTIHLMEQGRIVARGTYDELVTGNETFRRMAVAT